jgi:adenylate kinase
MGVIAVGQVLVITGTPGVGKSSVSRALALKLNAVNVNLSALVELEGLSVGRDTKRDTQIVNTKEVSRHVKELISRTRGLVIVEGHSAMDVVAKEDVLLAFVLRRSPDQLRTVLRRRGFDENKVAENVAAEILDICLFDTVKAFGQGKTCELETSGVSIEDTVTGITGIIAGTQPCHVGIVDWLGRLESEGRLDEFLASS